MAGPVVRISIGILALLALTSCTPPLYRWGSYEQSLYHMYGTPDNFNLDNEIAVLSEETEVAVERNIPVPPGKFAHLGYLYYQRGDIPLARQAFMAEKNLYPESATFMNRFLNQLR